MKLLLIYSFSIIMAFILRIIRDKKLKHERFKNVKYLNTMNLGFYIVLSALISFLVSDTTRGFMVLFLMISIYVFLYLIFNCKINFMSNFFIVLLMPLLLISYSHARVYSLIHVNRLIFPMMLIAIILFYVDFYQTLTFKRFAAIVFAIIISVLLLIQENIVEFDVKNIKEQVAIIYIDENFEKGPWNLDINEGTRNEVIEIEAVNYRTEGRLILYYKNGQIKDYIVINDNY